MSLSSQELPTIEGMTVSEDDNIKRTYLNGKLHSFNDEPAIFDIENGKKYWFKNGKRHRDGDKPAIVVKTEIGPWDDPFDEISLSWYQNGKLFRDGDKPAFVRIKKVFYDEGPIRIFSKQSFFYLDGKLGRVVDKPAEISVKFIYDKHGFVWEYERIENFYRNGELHRDGDKPAYIFMLKTYAQSMAYSTISHYKSFYNEGKLHRDGDKPAVTQISLTFDSNGNKEPDSTRLNEYYREGKLHRDGDKPAIVKHNDIFSGDYEEVFYKNGNVHRINNKPAYYHISETNHTEAYMVNNLPHRENGDPALFIEDFLEQKIFYTFFITSESAKDSQEWDKSFLLKEVKNLDSSLTNEELEEYPLNQIKSIASSLKGMTYVYSIPLTYKNYLSRIGLSQYVY